MLIKLAILEGDTNYLNRIMTSFESRYSDKLEIYSFTNPEMAYEVIEKKKVDVLLANESFDIDFKRLPKRCGFAYFVERNGIESINEQKTICKFQKAELIYKQILSIYSENAGNLSGFSSDDSATRIVLFTSASGGSGASTMAAACAVHYSKQGKNVLYLNLETVSSADTFFNANGFATMSDVIYAVKNKKANLQLKLESSVREASNHLYYFASANLPLDMMEFSSDERIRLLSDLKLSGKYDYIVVDADFGLDKETLRVYRQAHAVIFVSTGGDIANAKVFQAMNALSILEQKENAPLTSRSLLLYNMFSNKTCKTLNNPEYREIGGAPRFEHATTEMIVQNLSKLDAFDKIF